MIAKVQTTRFSNGLTILTEHMPVLRLVSIGIWVRRGSRHETRAQNGICHFIEHALFKGTQRRSAHDIATESDRLGGQFDAYTSHEMTGFAAKVVDTAMPRAFDLLSDMVLNPRFDEDDLAREQQVIIEEMKMIEDTPDELLTELFNAAYFPDHSLGRPIEGTERTVSSFDRQTTASFHAQHYAPRNFVIVAAPWPSALSQDRYAASMLGTIIGGGTSSRLWQSIREERGLTYSIGAGGSTFTDVGMFTIYAGASPSHLDQVLDLSMQELRRIVREHVSDDELRLAKEQAISSVLLSLESSSARVGALARQEIIHGRHISPDEIIKMINAVSCESVRQVAQSCFTTAALSVGALGNLNGFAVDRSRLEI